jgi:uncharacterized protein
VADVTARRWFLPDNPDLLGLLRRQATTTVAAMDALVAWAGGDEAAGAEVHRLEHEADAVKRDLWRGLRQAYSPPLDAEDLFSLSADLDEVLNAAKDLVGEMEVMDMRPDPPIEQMVRFLADGVRSLATAFERLGADGDATESADAAIKNQRRLEHAYRSAMSTLLEVSDLREVMSRREAYRRLSRIGALMTVVAERVWYAVVKEA